MPLKSGSSSKTVSSNVRELRSGKTFARTAAKSGKKQAQKQSVAIALNKARERALGGRLEGPPIGLAPFAGGWAPQGVEGPSSGLLWPMEPQRPRGFTEQPPQGLILGGPGLARGGAHMESGPGLTRGIKSMTKGALLSAVPGRTDAHKTHVPSGSYVIPADIVSGRGQGNTLAGVKALHQLFKMGPYGAGPTPNIAKGSGPARRYADGGEVPVDPSEGSPVRVNLAGGEIVVPPENLAEIIHPDLKVAHEIMDRWVLGERKKLRKTLAKLPGPVRD